MPFLRILAFLKNSAHNTYRISFLRKGTLEAVRATDCNDISQSAAYQRYALIAASLLLQVVSLLPFLCRNSIYDNRKSCVQSSKPKVRSDKFIVSVIYLLNTVKASRQVSIAFRLFNDCSARYVLILMCVLYNVYNSLQDRNQDLPMKLEVYRILIDLDIACGQILFLKNPFPLTGIHTGSI